MTESDNELDGDPLRGEMQKWIKNGRFAEMFRFAVNGGVSFLVDYASLYLLTEFAGWYYLISSAVSFTASVIVNYLICVFWVFEGAKSTGTKSKLVFIASSAAGLLINQLLMWFFVDAIGISYMIAKIPSTLVVMIWNYIMKRKALYL